MPKEYPLILAIDTSCDDTSVAVTQGMRVLSNIIASQEEIHRKYGGVMPLAAKLAHHELINPTYQEALKRAQIKDSDIDIIAVTYGPGLAIALEVGVDFAKTLSKELNKPLIAVNHMAGHLFSSLAVNSKGDLEPSLDTRLFPVLALLVSGNHTELVLVNISKKALTVWVPSFQVLGKTVDDAAGECLDKFARMLDLGYPGAAVMEQLAREGNSTAFQFPLPMTQSHDLNFSFSGLKTAGRHTIEKLANTGQDSISPQQVKDLAASFQAAVVRAILYKTKKTVAHYQPNEIWLGGGVIANLSLRKAVRNLCNRYHIQLRYSYTKKLIADNAAMIGIAAYFQYIQSDYVKNLETLHRQPRLSV